MKATNKAVQEGTGSAGLAQLMQRFEQWRAGRTPGARIPPELWAQAVHLAAAHGAYRVSVELHLDYAVLKRRVAAAGGKTSTGAVAPRFVELLAPAGAMATTSARSECVVEMDSARGAKMRVELSGNGLGSLAALCSAFWAA